MLRVCLIVLVFYCCVTNYHKYSSLKITFIMFQFPWVRKWGPLLRVSQGYNQGVSQIGGLIFQAYVVVSRIHFLVLVGMRPSAPKRYPSSSPIRNLPHGEKKKRKEIHLMTLGFSIASRRTIF